jgi:salicylate hydroxylase
MFLSRRKSNHQVTAGRGDSCHPMLPYLAQGANSSMEDGAALGTILKSVTRKEQLPNALHTFEKLRKLRSEAIARETFKQVCTIYYVEL